MTHSLDGGTEFGQVAVCHSPVRVVPGHGVEQFVGEIEANEQVFPVFEDKELFLYGFAEGVELPDDIVVGGEEGQLFNLLHRTDVDRQHLVISAMTLIRPVAGDIQPPSLYNRSF